MTRILIMLYYFCIEILVEYVCILTHIDIESWARDAPSKRRRIHHYKEL